MDSDATKAMARNFYNKHRQSRWSALVWDFTQGRVVVSCRHFETNCLSHLQGSNSPFTPEDATGSLYRNVVNKLPLWAAQNPNRAQILLTPRWKPQSHTHTHTHTHTYGLCYWRRWYDAETEYAICDDLWETNMNFVFWDVTPCILVVSYWRLKIDSRFLRNVRKYIPQ
jgi:hypothetical protein